MKKYRALICLAIVFIAGGCGKPRIAEESRVMMDTVVNIKAVMPDRRDAKPAIAKSFGRIKEIEGLLNKYDDKSEVALINGMKAGDKRKISAHMAFVLRRAFELSLLTDGAFDITVSPLVDIWSACRKGPGGQIPSEDMIRAALSRIGHEKIALDDSGNLSLLENGILIDLSAIAKGYAVDSAVEVLRTNGIKHGIVDAGGDIYCLGSAPDAEPWRIGIKNPRKGAVIGTLTLEDKAVATSGDYEKFLAYNGKRYSHIVDPRSGYPALAAPISATVIARDCITADGMATALSAMSVPEGLGLIERLDGIDAILISTMGDEIKVYISSGLDGCYEGI
ncbi:MAG: FAD:protein FMN transferase [Candidatus Omnitrophota bacterium]